MSKTAVYYCSQEFSLSRVIIAIVHFEGVWVCFEHRHMLFDCLLGLRQEELWEDFFKVFQQCPWERSYFRSYRHGWTIYHSSFHFVSSTRLLLYVIHVRVVLTCLDVQIENRVLWYRLIPGFAIFFSFYRVPIPHIIKISLLVYYYPSPIFDPISYLVYSVVSKLSELLRPFLIYIHSSWCLTMYCHKPRYDALLHSVHLQGLVRV